MENATGTAQQAGQDLSAGCPMSSLLEMLTRPWTLHILWLLSFNGPMRFGVLKRRAGGISARLLTLRLRTLEAEGLVRRSVVAGKVPEVTYSPTARLSEMNEVMAHLHRLSERWKSASSENEISALNGTAELERL
jgi:DNA-binding HxlR family transcriptional regulator